MNTIWKCGVAGGLASILAMGAGCGGDARTGVPEVDQNPSVDTPVEDASQAAKPDTALEDPHARDGSSDAPEEFVEEPGGELSAAHIVIMHKDSDRVPPGITRTREEARVLAEEVAGKAQAEGADFAALARQYSDGSKGPEGGDLGVFSPEEMVKPFSDATSKLAVGEVSGPVETQFGYHIIRRQKVPKASAKHILVMHADSIEAPPDITRTKQEAAQRIGECLARIREGESFEDLAREYSDDSLAQRGGDLGEFSQGKMIRAFEQATFACEVGQVTDVVETPYGYHIIYRYK